jgi:hypothetical protein
VASVCFEASTIGPGGLIYSNRRLRRSALPFEILMTEFNTIASRAEHAFSSPLF